MRDMFFILIVITLFCSCRREEAITEEEVINTIKRFDAGWENKNMTAVDSVLATTYSYFTQSGGIFSRDSVVATAGENSYSLRDMSRTEIKVTLSGNTAVASTRWRGEGVYRGTSFNEDQRCSIVLIKKAGKVEILSEHCTPIRTNIIFH